METFFWEATALHYFSLSMAVMFSDPVFASIALLTFALIPSLTETELVPGMSQIIEAQIENLKTIRYLYQAQ